MADLTKPFAFLITSRDGNAVRMWSHSQEAIKEVAESTPDHPSVISLFSEYQLASLLPGPHYMDPPDGGSVSVYEQLRRMALDAARYRWLRNRAVTFERDEGSTGTPFCVYGLGLGDSEPTYGTELDAMVDDAKAIDDAERKELTHG